MKTDTYDGLRKEAIEKYPYRLRFKLLGATLLLMSKFYLDKARENNDGLIFSHMNLIEDGIKKYFRYTPLKKEYLEFLNRVSKLIDNALNYYEVNLAYSSVMLYKIYIETNLKNKQFKISKELEELNKTLQLYHLKLIKAVYTIPEDKKKEWWEVKKNTDKTIIYEFDKLRYVLGINNITHPRLKDFDIKKYIDRNFDDIENEDRKEKYEKIKPEISELLR